MFQYFHGEALVERIRGLKMVGRFTLRCTCGALTTRRYAKTHGMRCKACFELKRDLAAPTRNERILEAGYAAYAREEE